MGVEYEVKFLNINVDRIRRTLRKVGAIRIHPFRQMVRSTYDLCNGEEKRAFVRVRQEADKVTMTSKIMDHKYPIENEVELNNTYEEGKTFLDSLGLSQKATQVTYREKWRVPSNPNVHEIVLDMIPGIPAYVEIDCKTENALHHMVRKMGFDMQHANHGAFAKQYTQYYDIDENVINQSTPSLTFENIHREIQPKTSSQKKMLQRVQRAQLAFIKALDKNRKKPRTYKRKRTSVRKKRNAYMRHTYRPNRSAKTA